MRMVISRRLIFCYVPKVACSNWKLTLRRAAGLPDLEQKSRIHQRRESGLNYLSDHNALVRLYYLNNPAFSRAVFVRNPWTRILSAYRSTIEHVQETDPSQHLSRFAFDTLDAAKAHCRAHGLLESNGPGLTFGEFLHYLEICPPADMNEHWQPQTLVAGLDDIRYNFVGRFEHLEADAERLTRMLGLPPFFAPRVVPKTDSSQKDILSTYYTAERLDQVARIYAREIELLGYEPPEI